MTAHRFELGRIGEGLPVAAAAPELLRAAGSGAMVVSAPPGTGKTTFVPPLVANMLAERTAELAEGAEGADGSVQARVLLTQPRRVAVRAAAARLAALQGEQLGGAVGYTVRGERRAGSGTRVEVLTPGVLLRRLLADAELPGVGAVILDEVHERSVEGDLLLGMLAELRALREDLIVVAMSATLDAGAIAALLGSGPGPGSGSGPGCAPAPVVEIPSPLHPLRTDYAPFAGARLDARGVTRESLAHLAELAAEAQRAEGCDALVFVPGAREVDEVVRLLRRRVAHGGAETHGGCGEADDGAPEILPLHGRLPAREQDRAVRGRAPGDPPRIVVSTPLAESSLTVPGVRLVIDSGLAREVRRDRARDMSGLVTVSASRASAEQRAGRAARQGPGRVIRAYAQADFARMPAEAAPEILAAELTDAALLLAVWGTPRGEGLALLTPPPAAAMDDAERLLRALDLVDAAGRPTALGARVAALPVGVREARALLAGTAELGDTRLAAEVVAAISDDHRDPGAELPRLLRELRAGRSPGSQRWRREADRLERIAGTQPPQGASATLRARTAHRSEAAGIVVALARPEWIARRTAEGSRSYLLASGTRAALPEGSGLLGEEWIAVREVQRAEGRVAEGTGAVIRLAAPLAAADALRLGAGLLSRTREAHVAEGRVRVREEQRLGAILLSSTPVAPTAEDARPARTAQLREEGLAALHWTDAASALRARLGLVRRILGEPWPAVDESSLLASLDDWLGPDLARLGPGESLRGIDIAGALRRLLPWPEAARLDELAPERLRVPSGSMVRIDYPRLGPASGRGSALVADGADGASGADADDSAGDADPGGAGDGDSTTPPVVAVKLQELFGLAETPRLVEGRVPVLFHLLSPARKPLAITDDLSSFWNGPYQQVRREMRGRYPRHPWPEDPWTAQATARTSRAARGGGR